MKLSNLNSLFIVLLSIIQEGLDDMPAHIRTMLTSNNLSFSVVDGKLEIGLWQAIYIWEHRASNKSRSLQLHAIGDFDLN